MAGAFSFPTSSTLNSLLVSSVAAVLPEVLSSKKDLRPTLLTDLVVSILLSEDGKISVGQVMVPRRIEFQARFYWLVKVYELILNSLRKW